MSTSRKNFKWILFGVIWGIIMFLIMAIATPYAEGLPLHPGKLMVKLVIWLSGGLACGYIVHLIGRRNKVVKDLH